MYLLSFLQYAKYTVVCNQIANKSFVLPNASIFGEYHKKPPLRSASHARRQDSVTGGEGGGNKNKIFRGGTKSLILRIRECGPKNKVFILKYARIFTNSGVNTKKSSSSQKMRKFLRIPGRNYKKRGSLLQNLQKTVFAYEFWGDNQYLGSLRPRIAL